MYPVEEKEKHNVQWPVNSVPGGAGIVERLIKTECIFPFNRSLPLQQQRRGRVEDIEFNLIQHPLALFPHLEESLPPDVSLFVIRSHRTLAYKYNC